MWREPREGDGRRTDGRRDDAGGVAAGMARLFGQMMLLPLVTFAYAVEAFARALREIQQTGDRTLDAFTGRGVQPPFEDWAARPRADAPRGWDDAAGRLAGNDYAALNVNAGAVSQGTQYLDQPKETEEREMSEHDLRGDDLKLVRWTLSFTKRDLEEALDFGVDMIDYSTTLGDYQGAKKIEYVENVLKAGAGFERPQTWVTEGYPDAKYIENRDGTDYVIGLPDEDKDKYLRVFVELLTRYEKEERPYKKVKLVQ
jgi:hypothetical protein